MMLPSAPDPEHPPQRWHLSQLWAVIFGETPPDLCAFCKDFTTWKHFNEQPHPNPTATAGKLM
ncbi:MAG UNVERIFIED_CONTAM: hypothetical protein LVT10_17785 [Anaerolineae bacterium]